MNRDYDIDDVISSMNDFSIHIRDISMDMEKISENLCGIFKGFDKSRNTPDTMLYSDIEHYLIDAIRYGYMGLHVMRNNQTYVNDELDTFLNGFKIQQSEEVYCI